MLSLCSLVTVFSYVMAQTSKADNFTYTRSWTYDDEKTWPGHKCKDGGGRQSPIDIRSEDIVMDYDGKFISHGNLKLTGYNSVLMTGINNGLTVQFSCDGEHSIHPVISGGPLAYRYRLEQLHFHWLSEHAVNGHKYPMEVHFVHVRLDLSVSEALRSKDGLAIIALFCNVQSSLNENEEERVSEIMEVIPMLLTAGSRVSGAIFDLKKLIHPTNEYYTYAGSLTSPECNEVVIWIIYENPIIISDTQYRLFSKIGVGRHNFRSLQPLRHHMVFKPRLDSVWKTPEIVQSVGNFFSNVTQFFKNVTRYAADLVNSSYGSCKNFTKTKGAKNFGL